jgi:hypothetical protein
VIEVREDLPLGPEAEDDHLRQPPPDHLYGDLLLVLVVRPHGEVDVAHAAPADLADDPVGTDPPPLLQPVEPSGKRGEHRLGEELADLGLGVEERVHLLAKLLVLSAGRRHEDRPLGRRPFERAIQHGLHLLPTLGCHRCLL